MSRLHRRWETVRQKNALRDLRRDPHLAKDIGLPPLPQKFTLKWQQW